MFIQCIIETCIHHLKKYYIALSNILWGLLPQQHYYSLVLLFMLQLGDICITINHLMNALL